MDGRKIAQIPLGWNMEHSISKFQNSNYSNLLGPQSPFLPFTPHSQSRLEKPARKEVPMDDISDGSEKKHELAKTPSTKTPSSVASASATSSYFLGCRKDANCHCQICLASIHATRDLISSNNPSRLFLSSSPPLTPSALTTPLTPPLLRSTAKSRPSDQKKEDKREGSPLVGFRALGFVALSLLLWVVDSGLVPKKWFGPQLEMEAVRRVGEDSRVLSGDLNGRVGFVQERLQRLVTASARVYNCGARDSVWELNQGGSQLFHWRCVVYKSMAEELNIWGSPLRTSGLLSTTYSSRHHTLLSGKITEWSDGKRVPIVRSGNSSSWTSGKWSYSAIQLDPETWVLEYRRNPLFQGPRLIPAIWEFMACKISEKVSRLKRGLLFGYSSEGKFVHPT